LITEDDQKTIYLDNERSIYNSYPVGGHFPP